MDSKIEVTISNQRGHKTLVFSPIGYADKVMSDELSNEFILESDRTNFEFVDKYFDGDLDQIIGIAVRQQIKRVAISVSISFSMSTLALLEVESISFRNCIIDYKMLPRFDSLKYLIVGDSVKMDLLSNHFPNLIDISFLSLKTFKGRLLDKCQTLKKVVIWHENKKLNEMLPMFPNLQHLVINHGSLVELDVSTNKKIETLGLHHCRKLEKVVLIPSIVLKEVVIENCKLLDQSNLGDNVK